MLQESALGRRLATVGSAGPEHWIVGSAGARGLDLRHVAEALGEIGAGETPPFIRGYNAGFDDAWAQQEERIARLRQGLLVIAVTGVCGSAAIGIFATLVTVPK